MEGVFIRKTAFWNVLQLLCGIGLIVLYGIVSIADRQATGGLIVLPIVGVASCVSAIFALLLNHGAYLRIEDDRLKGKFHWFGRLDCPLDQVDFVWAQLNSLTILLKNGKRYAIGGVENAWEFGGMLQERCFTVEKEAPAELRRQLQQAETKRKYWLRGLIGCMVLMFVHIFIAVALTGGRDLPDFSQKDWLILCAMGAVELLTVIALFVAAVGYGKLRLPIERLKHRLRGAVIVTQALPSGCVTAVYTDGNYTGRIVVCGFPQDAGVYYCVQEIVGLDQLKDSKTSEVYQDPQELPQERFDGFINITAAF